MANTAVTAAMIAVKIAICSSSDVMAKQAKMTSRTPPMKVTQPSTPIRVEIPGSMPLMDAWKLATPKLPLTCTHEPDRSVHQRDPAHQEDEDPEAEGDAGCRASWRRSPPGHTDWPTSEAWPAEGPPRSPHRRERRPSRPIPCRWSSASGRSSSRRPSRSGRWGWPGSGTTRESSDPIRRHAGPFPAQSSRELRFLCRPRPPAPPPIDPGRGWRPMAN